MAFKNVKFWPIKYNIKNIILFVFLTTLLGSSIYYFRKEHIIEGITSGQYSNLAEIIKETPEQAQLRELEGKQNTIQNNLNDLLQKIKRDTASYNAALAELAAAKAASAAQLTLVAPQFATQFSRIQSLGIGDPIYGLLITDKGLSNRDAVEYLKILVNDEVNIVG